MNLDYYFYLWIVQIHTKLAVTVSDYSYKLMFKFIQGKNQLKEKEVPAWGLVRVPIKFVNSVTNE